MSQKSMFQFFNKRAGVQEEQERDSAVVYVPPQDLERYSAVVYVPPQEQDQATSAVPQDE